MPSCTAADLSSCTVFQLALCKVFILLGCLTSSGPVCNLYTLQKLPCWQAVDLSSCIVFQLPSCTVFKLLVCTAAYLPNCLYRGAERGSHIYLDGITPPCKLVHTNFTPGAFHVTGLLLQGAFCAMDHIFQKSFMIRIDFQSFFIDSLRISLFNIISVADQSVFLVRCIVYTVQYLQ
jgi:hypothetical protein